MMNRFLVACVALLALCASPIVAQDEAATPDDVLPQALPSAALPFVAIKPCRLADTRDGAFPAGYGPPALSSGVVRVITFAGRCGIPSAIDAVSANLTVVNTQGPGFIATTSSTVTSASCAGMLLNGLGVRLAAGEATAICNAVTGAGFQSGNGSGIATPHFEWNGTNWVISLGGDIPMLNLTCSL